MSIDPSDLSESIHNVYRNDRRMNKQNWWNDVGQVKDPSSWSESYLVASFHTPKPSHSMSNRVNKAKFRGAPNSVNFSFVSQNEIILL